MLTVDAGDAGGLWLAVVVFRYLGSGAASDSAVPSVSSSDDVNPALSCCSDEGFWAGLFSLPCGGPLLAIATISSVA